MRKNIKGVVIIDSNNTYIEKTVSIGKGTKIFPGAFLAGKTVVGKKCIIGNGAILTDMVLSDDVEIKPYSVLESSVIKRGAVVGPFARIRPNTIICEDARIGNFVEVKKSKVGRGSKANHLTYLGDAVIGEKVNVGAGTITCNYDGFDKFVTTIEDDVFVGSDTQFIAPVKIGRGSTIGAGSTITMDVPPKSLAISRAEQVVVKGYKRKRKG